MNTTKKLLVLCLVAVVGIVSFMPSTFSWFNHSAKQSGDKMNYTRESLPVSDSKITMKTEYLTMEKGEDGKDLNTLLYDEKGNKIIDTTKGTGGRVENQVEIKPGHAQYFRTTFENTGNATSMVSISLANLSNMQDVLVGTISPAVNERAFSRRASLTRAASGKMRVYLKVPKTIKNWKDATSISIVANENTSNKIPMTKLSKARHNSDIWYGDLPVGTTTYYFYDHAGDTDKSNHWHRTASLNEYKQDTFLTLENEKTQDGNDYIAINTDEYRIFLMVPTSITTWGSSSDVQVIVNNDTSNPISMEKVKASGGGDYTEGGSKVWYADLPNSVTKYYFRVNSSSSGTNRTAEYNFEKNTTVTLTNTTTSGYRGSTSSRLTGLISVMNWYSKLSIIKGQGAQISLVNGTDYIGDKKTPLKYSVVKGSSYITVNSSTGQVSTASSMRYGITATIRTTITGVLGDTLDLDTEVESPEKLTTVPIAQNIKVPKGGKSSVEWYIMNGDKNSSAFFDNVFYTQ